ncbi:MAG TPA: ABC transporter permease [Terriglobales bacterium]
MGTLLQDLRYESRFLRKNVGFALAIILTLALSIGANTSVFTVTSALLLRNLPYSHPQDLVLLDVKRTEDNSSNGLSLNRYEMLRDQNHSFSGVAVAVNDTLNLTGRGEPQQAAIARVSPNFFSVLGVAPQLGRAFADEEGTPAGRPVMMISDALWRTRFNADPHIVGQSVDLDTVPYTIIGVLPRDVQFPFLAASDVWIPRYFEYSLFTPEHLRAGVGYLNAVARLKPGVSVSTALSEMNVLNAQYTRQNPQAPDGGADKRVTVDRLRDATVANVRKLLFVLSAAVLLVLLIACANVASLLLSRALARRKEIAVRSALGASRSSVVRQLLLQSLLLACISGALGLVMAVGVVAAVSTYAKSQLPAGAPIVVDWRVLLFTAGVSLLAGILFGIAPALQLARVNVSSALRDEGRGMSGSRSHMRLRNTLVIGQVALCLVLLIGAGLLLRSFVRMLNVDPGFDQHNLLTLDLSLPTIKYAAPEKQLAFFDEAVRRTGSIPGVKSAAISAALPLTPKRITPMLPEGQPEVSLAQRPFLIIEAVSPAWFQTMRVPLQGRAFTDADVKTAPKVAIVNQAFARRFWPNQNPLGKHVAIGRQTPSEVIGIAGDVHNSGVVTDPQPQVYVPFAQLPWADGNLLIRAEVEPHSVLSAVRQQIAAIDPEQPIANVQTGDELMSTAVAQNRFTTMLVGAFAVTAVILAIIGVYGTLAYAVAQRRPELSIRLALGAERSSILRLVVRQGLLLIGTGIVIGIVASFAVTRTMASMLYKVGSVDPLTFIGASVLLLAIAIAASYLPARRASEVSPLEVLR